MLQSGVFNSRTDVSLKKKKADNLVDATSSTSCMQQLVLVDVSMSDFISRWSYVVQMSMNFLCVCIHYLRACTEQAGASENTHDESGKSKR